MPTKNWNDENVRSDGMTVTETDTGYVITPPKGDPRPQIHTCPCCSRRFTGVAFAIRAADALYPLTGRSAASSAA